MPVLAFFSDLGERQNHCLHFEKKRILKICFYLKKSCKDLMELGILPLPSL